MPFMGYVTALGAQGASSEDKAYQESAAVVVPEARRTDGRSDGEKDRQTDRQCDRRTVRLTSGWADGRAVAGAPLRRAAARLVAGAAVGHWTGEGQSPQETRPCPSFPRSDTGGVKPRTKSIGTPHLEAWRQLEPRTHTCTYNNNNNKNKYNCRTYVQIYV
jgi:hypothetical protein